MVTFMNSDPTTRPVPLLSGTVISVTKAASIAGVSDDTIRRWAVEYGLGRQPGGHGKRMRISYPALQAFLADDEDALNAIRTGDFQSEIVKPYLAGRFEAGARL
jgi:hypothetical protein